MKLFSMISIGHALLSHLCVCGGIVKIVACGKPGLLATSNLGDLPAFLTALSFVEIAVGVLYLGAHRAVVPGEVESDSPVSSSTPEG